MRGCTGPPHIVHAYLFGSQTVGAEAGGGEATILRPQLLPARMPCSILWQLSCPPAADEMIGHTLCKEIT